MEITIENLERAVSQFYHSDSSLQAQAHQWLTAVQSSPNAWAFVWELLQPNRSAEVQFFAATTLHLKIMRNWNEVPSDQYEFLKNRLIEIVMQYSTGPKIVLNRLCIALSAYLIQTTPRYWENSLQELLTMFRPENVPNIPPERTVWILLEVLTVIPEEFQTMTLSQKHRGAIRGELEKFVPQVLVLVEGLVDCNQVSSELHAQSVKAAVAWLHLGVPLPDCIQLAQKLVHAVRAIAAEGTESAENELEALTQMATNPDTHKYPNSVVNFLNVILPLKDVIASSPDNPELISNVYKVFVGLGESHTRLLLTRLTTEQRDDVMELITLILDCTRGPGLYPIQETHSQLTFGFWYILQDQLQALPLADSKVVEPLIGPIYQQLCQVLLTKSQYPPDSVTLNAVDAESFRCYRQDIADTMVYCYYVVRGYLPELLSRVMDRAQNWQEVESVLHVAFALAETMSTQDDDRVVSLLKRVPPQYANSRVVNALNQSIGAFAEWFESHGEALGELIPGVVMSLNSNETAFSATIALKDITLECSACLRPLAQPLLQACLDALNKGHLKPNECVRLMCTVGKVLSLLPYELMVSRLQEILTSHLSAIELIVQGEPSVQAKSSLTLRLKMLGQLASTLYLNTDSGVQLPANAEGPTLILLRAALPVLLTVGQKWGSEPAVAQEMSSCLKSAGDTLLEKCEPLLEPMLNLVVACYSSAPNTAAIDLVRNVVLLFGVGTNSHPDMCAALLVSIASTTYSLASKTPNGASESSDVIQAFLNMVSNLSKKSPALMSSSVDCSELLRFATACLLLPEFATVKAAGAFISNLVTRSREHSPMVAAVQAGGQTLVTTSVRCIASEAPRASLDVFVDILLALSKKYWDDLCRWLNQAITEVSSPNLTPETKANFTRNVLKEWANKRKLQETVREFALVSRGLVNSEYTQSTAQSRLP